MTDRDQIGLNAARQIERDTLAWLVLLLEHGYNIYYMGHSPEASPELLDRIRRLRERLVECDAYEIIYGSLAETADD